MASKRVDGSEAGGEGFHLQNKYGEGAVQSPGVALPLLASARGKLIHKPCCGTQRSHFHFNLCWKHHMEKKM